MVLLDDRSRYLGAVLPVSACDSSLCSINHVGDLGGCRDMADSKTTFCMKEKFAEQKTS